MEIKLIAAVSTNNVISIEGKIPWKLPEDLKRFKDLTLGHPIIMGRVTYESLREKSRPLPGRLNVILTRDLSFSEKGVYVAHSLEEALSYLDNRNNADKNQGNNQYNNLGNNLENNSSNNPNNNPSNHLEESIGGGIGPDIDYFAVFICGGQQVYEQAMPYATALEITRVHQYIEGSEPRFFPEINPAEWTEQDRKDKKEYSFVKYVKR